MLKTRLNIRKQRTIFFTIASPLSILSIDYINSEYYSIQKLIFIHSFQNNTTFYHASTKLFNNFQQIIIIKFQIIMINYTSWSFNIRCKISEEQNIEILVDSKDDKSSIFQKILKENPSYSNKKIEVLAKIEKNLEKISKSDIISPQLKAKVVYFLKRIQNPQAKINKVISSNIKHSKSKINQTNKILDKNEASLYITDQKMKQNSNFKNESKLISGQNPRQDKKLKQNRQSSKIQRKKILNEDLIKAYEVIMKKSSNNDMKQLAKLSLKQMGQFKEEKREISKTICRLKTHQKQQENEEVSMQSQNQTELSNIELQSQQKQVESRQISANNISSENHTKLIKNKQSCKYKYLINNTEIRKVESTNAKILERSYICGLNSETKSKKYNYLIDAQ